MNRLTTRQLVELSLYAALIIISVQFLRIPVGVQFVHIGNALVVVAVLLYGSRLGALVATVGLGLFDMLNGYAAVVWITILESLIVCLVLHLVFEKMMHSDSQTRNVVIVGIIAAITKMVSNLSKYTIINGLIGGVNMRVAVVAAVLKIGGTFGTALVTIIAVPILYPILKRIFRR
ncbi:MULTISPECIES: ECF transporter S component [unclassified Streptococcus]|uniref:ECF transporter S component n=1 Tax=unclassified Streptococcus TaxID=2608887 RepID=UPI0010719D15|nr:MULTISPECIES: ECF transporter S component [unclassified Streptococcus]MBF0786728.1 ECF transporter S component [Streptococcus sp. 19428wC2_LYSM12]MCQ9211616.1 ECF transporter S component [Streptococcus sp. B01]MCQ9213192.1 ECF transporter S component [Streptococcus sp. O1]MCQ9214926.1 ECF transporter S component [Streptococcus sp. O1]TFV06500.1 hypothetical protein E4T79_02155 [Streptococcus sp. LYSM12]